MDEEYLKKLIEISTKLDILMNQFSNHLRHHFWYSTFAYTVMVGLIVSLVLIILKSR
jgi:hypothetical protein